MKFSDLSLIILISIITISIIGGYVSVKYLGPDNPIEETAEKIIESETGADINFSPNDSKDSKENKN